jgi:hypothetical protein
MARRITKELYISNEFGTVCGEMMRDYDASSTGRIQMAMYSLSQHNG